MTGYHVNWHQPERFQYKDWEILLQILSVKLWQEAFGPMKLVCDKRTFGLYKRLGILDIYDGVEMLDESLLEGIDPTIYFAAGKIVAQLQVEDEKCAFVDTDLLIYGPEGFIKEDRVTVFHREYPHESVYPDYFDLWQTEVPVNKDVYPLNCALLIWPNQELRRNYASHALKFMRNNSYHGNHKTNALMVTAEQRLLGMYLYSLGVEPQFYITDIYMSTGTKEMSMDWYADSLGSNLEDISEDFFHAWGFKHNLNTDPMTTAEYKLRLYTLLERYPDVKTDKILTNLRKI